MSKKKKLVLAAALAVCLLAAVGGTLAWFNAQYRTTNVITTGAVNIHILETQAGSGKEVPYVDPVRGVMPGTRVSKIVRVVNEDSAAWVRVRTEIRITGADGEALPATLADGTAAVSWEVGDGWLSSPDGYAYYSTPVDAQSDTTPLFEEVAFSEKMGNEYQGCTVNLVLYADAVQAKNNGADALSVQGWPENP